MSLEHKIPPQYDSVTVNKIDDYHILASKTLILLQAF